MEKFSLLTERDLAFALECGAKAEEVGFVQGEVIDLKDLGDANQVRISQMANGRGFRVTVPNKDRDVEVYLPDDSDLCDGISEIITQSPEFFFLLQEQMEACSWCAGAYAGEAYNREHGIFLKALNYAMLCIYSANGRRLPVLRCEDYARILLGNGIPTWDQLLRGLWGKLGNDGFVNHGYHFMVNLTDKMEGLNEYSKIHLLVAVTVAIEALEDAKIVKAREQA